MNPKHLLEQFGPREAMAYDVVIVGAGPAGLATAIRLKELNAELSVIVLEKGSGFRRVGDSLRRRRIGARRRDRARRPRQRPLTSAAHRRA